MISHCQLCKNRATWHDLGILEKDKLHLVCDDHLPPETKRKNCKWTYNKDGWVSPSFFGYNK